VILPQVAMYVIFATALAGFIILLVQFVDLLTKVLKIS